jgi:hypothetical protein
VSACGDALAVVLADGAWHRRANVQRQMVGWSERAVRRAALELGIEYERRGFPGVTWWRLSGEPSPTRDRAQPSRTFDVGEAAKRWRVSRDTATAFIFGRDGFVERGYLEASVDGHLAVTPAGVAIAYALAQAEPPEVEAEA